MKKIFLKELFYVLTGALVIFGLMELFWDRVVLTYININWVLILWLVVAIFILLQKYEINE